MNEYAGYALASSGTSVAGTSSGTSATSSGVI